MSSNNKQQLDHYKDCDVCKSKNSIILDKSNEELVCTTCGVVKHIDEIEYYTNFMTDKDLHKQNIIEREGGSTYKTGIRTLRKTSYDANRNMLDSKQMYNMYKLSKTSRFVNKNSSKDKSLAEANAILRNVQNKIILTDSIMDRTIYWYNKSLDNRITKGRTVKNILAACIYIACKEMGINRTFKEIAEHIGISTKGIFAAYSTIVKILDINVNTFQCALESESIIFDSINYFINKTLSNIFSDARNNSYLHMKNNIYIKALEISKDFQHIENANKYYTGKNPNVMALSILYIAALITGNSRVITQTLLESYSEITSVSIRKRYKEIAKIIVSLEKYNTDYRLNEFIKYNRHLGQKRINKIMNN